MLFCGTYIVEPRMKILLGITGSVAAIKVVELVKLIRTRENVELKVIITEHGKQFLHEADLEYLTSTASGVYSDESEWTSWNQKGDPVLHIELGKWCEIFLICPLTANTLASMANGTCNNLLTSTVRAWDKSKRMIVCPAMNTYMWNNPFTQKHLDIIQQVYNCDIVPPKPEHALACGDIGPGALSAIDDIVGYIFS